MHPDPQLYYSTMPGRRPSSPLIVDGQPNRGTIGSGPLHTMFYMGADVDPIARVQFDGLLLVDQSQSGGTLEHDHPFRLILVMPEPWWRGLTARDDSLDTKTIGFKERVEEFV